MRRPTLVLLIALLAGQAFSQITGDFREMFLEAESYFLFEEYLEAMPYYESLNKQYPDNDNINYKIGVCLLNDPYQKSESIRYLEIASQNISHKYKENSFKETKAPLEVLFYLGNAYRINGQLDKAIRTYGDFKLQADPELYDIDLVDEQVSACENAKELQTRPIDFDISSLGDRINTRHSDVNPVISGNEKRIVYIQKQAFYDALAYSEKLEDGWSFPRILMQEMAVDEDAYPTALNHEGDELIIYRSDNFIGDLYTSRLVDGFWTPPVRMNDNINTKYWESHACFTRSGDTLYFTSNRKGTIGGLDIYYSIRGEDGEWGVPVNLGPTINTRYNEETPFITEDGKTLYFSSYGHYNMGGYDVFYTTRLENGEWSVPVNAGHPINTTDDDLFFHPVQNGKYAYFPRLIEGGLGKTDIYMYEIYSEAHPRKFLVRGVLGITDLEQLNNPVRIAVISQHTRDTVTYAWADPETGEFTFEAPVGEYELLVEGEDIESTTMPFVIPEDYMEKELAMKQSVVLTQARHLVELALQDDIKVEDTLILVETNDPVEIDMRLERKATLFVDVYQEGKSAGLDSFAIDRRQFTYHYVPAPGDNLLRFRLIDKKGDLSSRDVHVIYTPKVEVADILSPGRVEQTIEQPPEPVSELENYLAGLTSNSTGPLHTFLKEIDLAALEIDNADQLNNYLIGQAATEDYTEEEVRRLLVITPEDQNLATETLRQDLAGYSRGELRNVLTDLDLEAEGINSEEDLIFWLRDHVDEYNYTRQDINDLIVTNVQAEYLTGYRDELLKISHNDALSTALKEVDFAEMGTLQELYEHLVSEADRYGYEVDDVNRMFALLSQKEELNELLSNLTQVATGDLLKVLQELDTEKKGIDNPSELITYLLDEAENNEYTGEEAMILMFGYLEEEDIREVLNLLIGSSSGELQNLLLNLDTEQNNIYNLDDLYNYLINQAKYHNYTEDDVIRLFLKLVKIVEQEPIVEEIILPEPQEEEKVSRGWIYFILGGIGLAVIILIVLLRKKARKDDKAA